MEAEARGWSVSRVRKMWHSSGLHVFGKAVMSCNVITRWEFPSPKRTQLPSLSSLLTSFPFPSYSCFPVSLLSPTNFNVCSFTIRRPTTAIDYHLQNGPLLEFKILITWPTLCRFWVGFMPLTDLKLTSCHFRSTLLTLCHQGHPRPPQVMFQWG